MTKRARQDSEWNSGIDADDNQDDDGTLDPSSYQASANKTNSTKASKSSKHDHQKSKDPDAAYRTALPASLDSTVAPVAGSVEQKLPQEIQYQIIPVTPANSSNSDSPVADTRAYIIKPLSAASPVNPTDVKPTLDGTISNTDLSGMVSHLETQDDSKPALALLRAIENYRLAVSEQSPATDSRSRSTAPHNSSTGSPSHMRSASSNSASDDQSDASASTSLPLSLPTNATDTSSLE